MFLEKLTDKNMKNSLKAKKKIVLLSNGSLYFLNNTLNKNINFNENDFLTSKLWMNYKDKKLQSNNLKKDFIYRNKFYFEN